MRVVNTYIPVVTDLTCSGVVIMLVLTQDDVGLFKVYSGLVRLPPSDDPYYSNARAYAAQHVMGRGCPERFERAVTYFPAISREEYRA